MVVRHLHQAARLVLAVRRQAVLQVHHLARQALVVHRLAALQVLVAAMLVRSHLLEQMPKSTYVMVTV